MGNLPERDKAHMAMMTVTLLGSLRQSGFTDRNTFTTPTTATIKAKVFSTRKSFKVATLARSLI